MFSFQQLIQMGEVSDRVVPVPFEPRGMDALLRSFQSFGELRALGHEVADIGSHFLFSQAYKRRLRRRAGAFSSSENWSFRSSASTRSRTTRTRSPMENSRRERSPMIFLVFSW